MPTRCRDAWPRDTAASRSAAVVGGSTRSTSTMASSLSVPKGIPSSDRSMRPSRGSDVSGPMPARSMARLLTQALWPSALSRYTGRSGTMLSSRAADAGESWNAACDQPSPTIQVASG